MNDKQKLIDSMSNLIYHVSSSRKNQQQIFATLSVGDLNKIISNLEDTSQSTLQHIHRAQEDYSYPLVRALILEPKSPKEILLIDQCVLTYGKGGTFQQFSQIYSFRQRFVEPSDEYNEGQFKFKYKILQLEQKGLFWYIDAHSKQKSLQIGKRNSYIPDPLTSIVGLWINVEKKNHRINTDSTIRQVDVLPSRTQIKNQSNQKFKINRSINYERNGYSDLKPETPMTNHKINLSEAMMTQSLKYRPNLYTQTYTPIINKSMRIQVPRIVYTNTTQRKNYDPINYDPVKTTRPANYQSYTTPLTSTNQQYMNKNVELFPTMTSTTVSLNSNKMAPQPLNNGQFPRQQYRNR